MSDRVFLHQTHLTIGDFAGAILRLKKDLLTPGLHLYPELFLTGYPLQDLVLKKPFADSYERHLSELNSWLKSQKNLDAIALVGGLRYSRTAHGVPDKIENVIYEISSQGIRWLYTKRLLPNYDIFDEQKYFKAGSETCLYSYQDKTFGLLICEDMWPSTFHQMDPCLDLKTKVTTESLKLDGIINLSASPFDLQKSEKRLKRASEISQQFGVPFIYVNRVGGEDEILFDGSSFIVHGEKSLLQLSSFKEESESFQLMNLEISTPQYVDPKYEQTWESLFQPRLDTQTSPAKLHHLSTIDCEKLLQALIFGIKEYSRKNGFKKYLVALSGGMDSALVLTLLKLAFRENPEQIEAIYMPSQFSSSLSTKLSEELCQNLNIKLHYFPIKFLHANIKNTFHQTFMEPFAGLTDENVQSRLRGMLLYTRSNQTGAMVLNTSNKSELAVGYSTQYGDSVGALSPLGDLYKSEVYALAAYINHRFNQPIPAEILSRGPSAELRENQLDQDSLPPYERLDAILEGILSYRLGKKELVELGFDENEIAKVLQLYTRSEYKRAQFCPIIKVQSKSFGFGYRIPLSKISTFHFE